MLIEPGIMLRALLVELREVRWNRLQLGLVGAKAGGFFDFAIPVSGPDTVGGAGAGGPGQHCFLEFDANRIAE